MVAGYGTPTPPSDGTECLIPYGEDGCLATSKEVYSNVGSAIVAGTAAGIIGTVVSLAIVIPLSPLLAKLGTGIGV